MLRLPVHLTLFGLVSVVLHAASVDAEFDALAKAFLREYHDVRPLAGVALGLHEYDGKFAVPDRAWLTTEVERLQRAERALRTLAPEALTGARHSDRLVLLSSVANELWRLETTREPQRNPMFYAGALDISVYLKRNFKPLPSRVSDITAILGAAPALFAAARANLDEVLPVEFIETAIEVADGTASFLEKDVAKEAATIKAPDVIAAFTGAMQAAVREIRGYIEWLK